MRSDEESVNVLQLVTTPRPFFRQQVEVLEQSGVSSTVVRVPPADGRRLGHEYAVFYGQILSKLATGTYDLVHANFGLTLPFALAQPIRPVVVSLWGTDVFGEYGWVTDRFVRWTDAVIVMSEEMNDAVDVEANVIPHGIDFDLFEPMPRMEARREVGWDADLKHVLFPYDPDRHVKNFPRAERIVTEVAGQVDEDVAIQPVYNIPHERVPLYINAADAFLMTSKWEGSPNAIREALACNLPIVSTDVGDVAERLNSVSYSHVCESDQELVNALVSVLAAGERSDGRQSGNISSLTNMRERILDVYESAGVQCPDIDQYARSENQ
ncbi:glycosyltransferase [Halorubrum halophilum]|uniref:glycosyltransferase n=1 Tax=Halorubrum halophilum TaxID=413816 RepID=UPI0006786FBE|nr:glycosyltransferase [Halorubrum halophilum]